MNLSKINPWIVGIILVFAGTLLIYFETYRNNEAIGVVSFLLILLGWVTLFIRITKGTSIDAKKIFFKDDKAGWFQQRVTNLSYYLALFAALFGNIYYISNAAYARKGEILANQPTKTAVVEVGYIDIRRGRNSTSYYAVFQYTVDGKIITHPWYEKNGDDFLVGDKYIIKYSVEYPEMFVLKEKLP